MSPTSATEPGGYATPAASKAGRMRSRAAAPQAATRSATVAAKRSAAQEPKCAIAARAAMNQTASVEIR